MAYLLSLHLIAVVCWFAGLFYLPRLFVYHAATRSKEVSEQFKVMEHKLYFYIMTPSMVVTVLSGLGLMVLYLSGHANPLGWLWLKIFLVLFLVMFHFYCGHCLNQFKADCNPHAERFFRLLNELPTVLLMVIILLAVVQPF